jgi:hypothetical protein
MVEHYELITDNAWNEKYKYLLLLLLLVVVVVEIIIVTDTSVRAV